MGHGLRPLFESEKAVHELSKNYPGYSPAETQKKIDQAKKLTGPMTCRAIKEKTGFNCPSGGCGVVCPVHLSGGQISWESPVLLDEHTPPVFDVVLPGILGSMVNAVSLATETPIELPVSVGLGAVSAAIHGKVIVEVNARVLGTS